MDTTKVTIIGGLSLSVTSTIAYVSELLGFITTGDAVNILAFASLVSTIAFSMLYSTEKDKGEGA